MRVPDLLVDLHSDVILEGHLQCAAFEMPLHPDDSVYFGPSLKRICDARLVKDKDGWCVSTEGLLPETLSIRQVSHPRQVHALPCEARLYPRHRGGTIRRSGRDWLGAGWERQDPGGNRVLARNL